MNPPSKFATSTALNQCFSQTAHLAKFLQHCTKAFSVENPLCYLALTQLMKSHDDKLMSYAIKTFVVSGAPYEANFTAPQRKALQALQPVAQPKIYSVQPHFSPGGNDFWDLDQMPSRGRGGSVLQAPTGFTASYTVLENGAREIYKLMERDTLSRFEAELKSATPTVLTENLKTPVKQCLREMSALGVTLASSVLPYY